MHPDPRCPSWLPSALAVLVAAGLLAVGLVHAVWFLVWALAAGVLAVAAEVAGREGTSVARMPAAFLLLLAALCALQLLPLPPQLLELLSPVAFQLRSALRVDASSSASSWMPLTIDGAATTAELVKYLGYSAVALVATRCVGSDRGRRRLSWSVVAIGALFTLASVLHTAFPTTPLTIWWSYVPERPTVGLVRATLVNSNHIAGVFGAVAPMTLALGLGREGVLRRALLVLGCAQILLALLTLSRSGALGVMVGVFTLVLLLRKGRGDSRGDWSRSLPALVVASFAAAVAWVVARQQFGAMVVQSGAIGRDPKFRVWRDALALAKDYWLSGAGRGTFSVAFTRYESFEVLDDVTFHHAENLPLQLASEWGLAVAVLVLLTLLVALARALRTRTMHRSQAGALAGLAALLTHDFGDFALELPAVAALAVVLAALAFSRNPGASVARGEPVSGPIHLLRRRWTQGVGPALLVVIALAWSTVVGGSHRAEGEVLGSVLRGATASTLPPQASEIVARHPADYALPLAVGQWAARQRHPDTLRWLNRSLFLNPRGSRIHLTIARALASAGLSRQGLLELREAERVAPLRSWELSKLAVALVPHFDGLRVFIGTGRGSGRRASYVANALQLAGLTREHRAACMSLVARKERVLRELGLACLGEAEARLGHHSRAREVALQLAGFRPGPIEWVRAIVVLKLSGAPSEVRELERRAIAQHPHDRPLLRLIVENALERGDGGRAVEFATRLRGASGSDVRLQAQAGLLECRAHLAAGEPAAALRVAERGLSVAPDDSALIACLADAAEATGDRRRARDLRQDLAP